MPPRTELHRATLKKLSPPKYKRNAELYAMHEAGVGFRTIAFATGLSRSCVRQQVARTLEYWASKSRKPDAFDVQFVEGCLRRIFAETGKGTVISREHIDKWDALKALTHALLAEGIIIERRAVPSKGEK
jgi:hypothetical protein